MFVLMKSRSNLKMGHIWSKTRSLGQILEKHCVCATGQRKKGRKGKERERVRWAWMGLEEKGREGNFVLDPLSHDEMTWTS